MEKKCRHKNKLYAQNLKERHLQCEKCGFKSIKKQTKKQAVAYKKTLFDNRLHKLWHDFNKFCMIGKINKKTKKYEYKYKGYDMMVRARKFAAKHPEITFSSVDDDHFCSSLLVFIPSKRPGYYMGCNVVYIPQCNNDDPTNFFLYPDHTRGLVEALSKVAKQIPKSKKERWRKPKTFKITV